MADTNRILVNEKRSSWCDLSSGISQGSLLGPVLFVLLDVRGDVDSNEKKNCADDTDI